MFLTHRAEASIIHMHGLYIAKDLNPTSIQKEPQREAPNTHTNTNVGVG